tara:strand:- start:3912 stop:4793 length:882 start_codon:yes stop_codon:yes gene_type:complete
MSNNTNPLAGHFRTPKLYTGLPSKGEFYDEDTVDMPSTKELAVFPMTAKDEIMMKNPDALLNGEAVARTIMSCVPTIKKPRNLVANDVDALLVAIQAATYGDEIDVGGECPQCGEKASAVLSGEVILANMETLNKKYEFTTDSGLLISMKPFSYETSVKAGVANFRSSRSLQSIDAIEDEMEKIKAFNTNFIELAKLNFDLLVDSISTITVPSTEDSEEFVVSNVEHITEFLENADASISNELESFIEEIGNIGIQKKMELTCVPCSEELPEGEEFSFETIVNFNTVNFFTAS